MPNPPFTPLTLSVEEWQKLRSTDLYFIPSKQDAIYKELEAQAQEAATRKEAWVAAVAECASLRQRLEEAEKEIASVRAHWANDCRMAHLNGYDDAKHQFEARASQAEAALEEMQKQLEKVEPFYPWDASLATYKCIACGKVISKLERLTIVDPVLLHFKECVLAELQRRRSRPAEETRE